MRQCDQIATPDEIARLLAAQPMYSEASQPNCSRDIKKLKQKITYYRNTPDERIPLTDRPLVMMDVLIDKLKNYKRTINKLKADLEAHQGAAS